jgi:hypothetical protein
VRYLVLLTAILVASAALPAVASASEVLVVAGDGSVRPADDPNLPPPAATDPLGGTVHCTANGRRARALPPVRPAAGKKLTVRRVLSNAQRSGAISTTDYRRYRDGYAHAQSTLGGLSGYRRTELKAVLDTLDLIASIRRLTPSRMPALFLTLQRNDEYWGDPRKPIPVVPPPPGGTKKAPCAGQAGQGGARVTFQGDPVIFQWYSGRGLQIQQLANFGAANGLYQRCKDPTPDPANPCDKSALAAMLDRLAELASTRGGFKAWEYFFPFGGGAPPWISGLAQGTAIQAFARGYELLGARRYIDVGRAALGAFQAAPPVGVRVAADGGSHYLIYSMAPGERVLNGFLQALTGLYDFGHITGDRTALGLFRAGDRAARREVPRFDTGAWSRYSQGGPESDLGYHRLVRDFLRNLCTRTKAKVYCDTATRFTQYQRQPPVVSVKSPRSPEQRKPVLLRFSLSKISCTKVTVVRNPPPEPQPQPEPGQTPTPAPGTGGVQPAAAPQLVYERQIVFGRGGHAVQWTPRKKGRYELTVQAIDLNGHTVAVSVRFEVR